VPENANLISTGDNSNSTVPYLRFVDGIRKDLKIYDPIKIYRTGGGKGAKTESGFNICMNLISTEPEKTYIVKEQMLRRGLAIDYTSMTLAPQGMVYAVGNQSPTAGLWNRLEIPQFDDIEHLEIKGQTMLGNLYLSRGEDRQWQGDSTSAYRDFLMTSDMFARSMEASVHNSLGVFFRRHRITGLAEEEFQRALNSQHLTADERANIFVNLGNLRKDKGNFDQAMEYYDMALGINTHNIDARYNLTLTRAYLSLRQGDAQNAVDRFEEAVVLPGADLRLIFNLGVLYDQTLNDTVKAIYHYRRFVELAPGMPESQTALRRIERLSGAGPVQGP
jgi:tetratricopeptide (TPR) repeat protein